MARWLSFFAEYIFRQDGASRCCHSGRLFKHHAMSNDFVSDRDPRFTPDGQTERVSRVLEGLLKGYAQSFHH
ncbi:reverse transcriptase [Phytophthora megakarya]|uniref:Reverse transcriptase n=1 Tax=Phytophthora megakarya TaxID=4795 RepID=A0A225V8C4_9STRA|nr:reverse transcriptase [Phytophthora megakarya]